jgi:hypothetical protein
MATKKPQLAKDEKFENVDVDLFAVLNALDTKDYGFYDRLTAEQKKKIVPFMLTHWMSAIKGSEGLARYYVMSVNEYANKHLFSEFVQKHPKLQWMMLCSASPGVGKQFHQWIPHIREKVIKYKEAATLKEIKEYYTKIYPKADAESINEVSKAYVTEQKRKLYLGQVYPNMKTSDLEVLNQLVTDEDIEQYERDRGNL